MLFLSLTFPYSDKRSFTPILFNNGLVSAVLKMHMGAAHELILQITPDLGEVYDILKDPTRLDVGVKLKTDYGVEIDFIKNQNGQKDYMSGLTSLSFYSDIYRLKKTRPGLLNTVYTGSIASFISSIDNSVVFTLKSLDNINTITAGLTSNYDLFSEAVESIGNWNWVQVSNVDGKTSVLYGDFRGDEPEYEARILTSGPGFTNSNIVSINSIESRDFLGENNTIVIPYAISGGQGADPSSITYITNPNNITRPNSRFPMFESGFSSNGKPVFWIKDVEADQILGEQYVFYEFTMTDGFTQDGTLELSPADVQNRLYFQAIGFMRSQSRTIKWNYTLSSSRLIFPGSRVHVIAKKDQQFLNGKRVAYDIDEVQYIKEIEYDLAEIYKN